MCLILDANKYSDFLDLGNEDMEPVRDWVEKKGGKIAYAATKEIQRELKRHQGMKEKFDQYYKANNLKEISEIEVDQIKNKLSGLESNDPHIIALAQAAKVRLLVSDDQKLGEDFQRIIRGKIYKNKKHKHLLSEAACP